MGFERLSDPRVYFDTLLPRRRTSASLGGDPDFEFRLLAGVGAGADVDQLDSTRF